MWLYRYIFQAEIKYWNTAANCWWRLEREEAIGTEIRQNDNKLIKDNNEKRQWYTNTINDNKLIKRQKTENHSSKRNDSKVKIGQQKEKATRTYIKDNGLKSSNDDKKKSNKMIKTTSIFYTTRTTIVKELSMIIQISLCSWFCPQSFFFF